MKPNLKPPGSKLLKLRYGKPRSKLGFKFNLRCYNLVRYNLLLADWNDPDHQAGEGGFRV
jgi:hypothetical protein